MSNYFYHPLGENANSVTPSTYALHQYGAALDFVDGQERLLPIYSMTDGTVIWSGTYGGGGNAVIIETTNTGFNKYYRDSTGGYPKPVYVKYLHLNDITIEKGATVIPGTLIGHMGKTGVTSNGVWHLHLDMSSQAPGAADIKTSDVNDFRNIIDVTGNSGYPRSMRNIMSNYDNYVSGQAQAWSSAAGIGNRCSYLFCIFNQTPQLITSSLPLDSSNLGPALTNEDILKDNHGFTYSKLMDIASGLCLRELGFSLDGNQFSLSAWGVYAKLLRHSMFADSDGLYGVMTRPGRFSGFSTTNCSLANRRYELESAGIDENLVLKTVEYNIKNPDTLNILPEHFDKIVQGDYLIFYNYGYGNMYTNTKENEDEINNRVKNDPSFPKHPASFGPYFGAIGNTGFWGSKINVN